MVCSDCCHCMSSWLLVRTYQNSVLWSVVSSRALLIYTGYKDTNVVVLNKNVAEVSLIVIVISWLPLSQSKFTLNVTFGICQAAHLLQILQMCV